MINIQICRVIKGCHALTGIIMEDMHMKDVWMYVISVSSLL